MTLRRRASRQHSTQPKQEIQTSLAHTHTCRKNSPPKRYNRKEESTFFYCHCTTEDRRNLVPPGGHGHMNVSYILPVEREHTHDDGLYLFCLMKIH